MKITLHCGGMPFDCNTIKTKSLGGSESAAYYMAKELGKLGHQVTVFTNTPAGTKDGNVEYVPAGNITQDTPLGDMFHFYALNTPVDVTIIQRHPMAFRYNWASKVNLWWLHDLALYRNANLVQDQMWNVDGVLTVSEWHKEQVCEVYNLNRGIVHAITNGVDLDLFRTDLNASDFKIKEGDIEYTRTKLLYSSRPERGLEDLVKSGGIMEKLYETDKNIHLYVCGYDNTTPEQSDYYKFLWSRCDTLPNVTNLGALTKQQLADVQRQADLHVYPSHFKETSCITAMECMAAGLPMIASDVGALPETVLNSGTVLMDVSGTIDPNVWTAEILKALEPSNHANLRTAQAESAEFYSWHNACQRLLPLLETDFTSNAACIKGLIADSDYYAAKEYLDTRYLDENAVMDALNKELKECYSFTEQPVWDEHYESYYQYEKNRGVEYGPEDLSRNDRFIHVANIVGGLSIDGVVPSNIIDYGCAHGHYTINLAKRFPHIQFIGVDITESNIEKARRWAEEEKLDNVTFHTGRVENGGLRLNNEQKIPLVDAVIAAEVLEHVADPQEHVNVLQAQLNIKGTMIITTPYGPWEAQGYKEHWPWRAHVHHFELEDIKDVWGHNEDFNIVNVPSGKTKEGDNLGSYVYTWVNNYKESHEIDYDRKLKNIRAKQTISCCMIVKDAESTIRRCLESVMPYVDELVIGFDASGNPETIMDVKHYMINNWREKAFSSIMIQSPLESGFDVARNHTVEAASGDWIICLDADEYLHNGHNLAKYLRHNQYNGYGIAQNHIAADPVGLLTTDYPIRVFRNRKDIRFIGMVHEHPEIGVNEGVGYAVTVPDVSIIHDGYKDEETRKGRLSRNIGLLKKDREVNPGRHLGKALWMRDLTHLIMGDLEIGTPLNQRHIDLALEGIMLWEELVDSNQLRYATSFIEYYSALVGIIKPDCISMEVSLKVSKMNTSEGNKSVQSNFYSEDHAIGLINAIFDENTDSYNSEYF